MADTYRIANWDAHFETDETRKRESLRWVPMPNKHDGLGFRTVAAQRNASELYAAWVLMLQLASKARRGQRGILARDGAALTAEDMAIMTGFPKDGFTRALDFFTQKKVGWITVEQAPDQSAGSAVGDAISSVPAALPAVSPADDAVSAGLNGREEKERKEGKPRGNAASPSEQSVKMKALHLSFCEASGYVVDLNPFREKAWTEYLRRGFTEEDFKRVLHWIRQKINVGKGGFSEQSTQFDPLITHADRFEQRLLMAKNEPIVPAVKRLKTAHENYVLEDGTRPYAKNGSA